MMKFYHGSPHKIIRFLAPEETGNFRLSEKDRQHHRDVIFLTSSRDEALRYAGPRGYLYLVDASNTRPYNQTGKRKPRLRDGVFVADPEKIEILLRLKLAPRRRNQSQAFELANN